MGFALHPNVLCARLPPPIIPESVGVHIHFTTGHERELDMIAAAGIRWVRRDLRWADIEYVKGRYDWSDYDELMRNLERRGLGALFILSAIPGAYGDPLITTNPVTGGIQTNVAAPSKADTIAAYARWASAAAQRYRGRKVLYEIWNEPDILEFWKPAPNVTNYSVLALATAAAIRGHVPEAVVVAPAASKADTQSALAFLETFFQHGILGHLEAVTVHPYRRGRSPESAGPDFARLRKLIDRYAPDERKGKIPVICSEWGYSIVEDPASVVVSPETQAAFVVRQQLVNLLHGVPLTIWYEWNGSGYGLVEQDLQPRLAYHALRTLARELGGFSLARRHDTGRDTDYALVFTNAVGQTKLAVWTTEAEREVTLALAPQSARTGRLVSGLGEARTLPVRAGAFTLTLTARPQYVIWRDE